MGVVLVLIHYFSEKIHLLEHIKRMKFVSFTSGVFITYLILDLLPTIFEADHYATRLSLVFVLIGFSLFHLLEKFVYRHEDSLDAIKHELKEVHSIAFFLYHIITGLVLVNIFNTLGTVAGILFFIPLMLTTMVSSVSLKGIHGRIRERRIIKVMLSISTILGILLAIAIPVTTTVSSVLLGFVIGALLFTVIVDAIPRERRGAPTFFVLGVALYAVLIGVTWLL